MQTDILVPDFDSALRQSPLVVAIFNLSATIVGGGVLSLPLAYSKCGLVLGTLLMLVAAVVTERTLYLLCISARITGATNYSELGRIAFGKKMEYFIITLLFVFLMFVLVGYMVLVQDIWSSLTEIVLGIKSLTALQSDLLLLGVLLLMSPFLLQKRLHSLRFNCYVSFASLMVLCFALCRHAMDSMETTVPATTTTTTTTTSEASAPFQILLWSDSPSDILFAFPIIVLSFLSIFNVLPVQGALIQPTRGRLLIVLNGAIGSSLVLMLLFGIAGYYYAGPFTQGNILQNTKAHEDWMFLLGTLGCGISMFLAIPMIFLPCRASLLDIVEVIVNGGGIDSLDSVGSSLSLASLNERQPLLTRSNRKRLARQPTAPLEDNYLAFYATTAAIAIICYVAAIMVPGVEFVWSLCGSFMAFLIAFILPAVCYLQIQRYVQTEEHKSTAWVCYSWVLLVTATVASIACTIQTIGSLL